MAAYDVEHQDPLTFFRSETNPADLARAQHEWAIQRQQDHQTVMTAWTVLAVICALAVLGMIKHRLKIARAADAVVVSGLASGVRAARKAQSRRASWVARIVARADEKPPTSD